MNWLHISGMCVQNYSVDVFTYRYGYWFLRTRITKHIRINKKKKTWKNVWSPKKGVIKQQKKIYNSKIFHIIWCTPHRSVLLWIQIKSRKTEKKTENNFYDERAKFWPPQYYITCGFFSFTVMHFTNFLFSLSSAHIYTAHKNERYFRSR